MQTAIFRGLRHTQTHTHTHPSSCHIHTLIKAQLSPIPQREGAKQNKIKCFNSYPPLRDTITWQNSQVILIRPTEHHMLRFPPQLQEKEKSHFPRWQQRARGSAKAGGLAQKQHSF